jgi:hypothetical protein
VSKAYRRGPLWRRVIALVCAYAIALSGLTASFGGINAAAALADGPGIAICQIAPSGDLPPKGDRGTGDLCLDYCCLGCLMLAAALPPPPANPIGKPQSLGRRIEPASIDILGTARQVKSHRSRAPPSAA